MTGEIDNKKTFFFNLLCCNCIATKKTHVKGLDFNLSSFCSAESNITCSRCSRYFLNKNKKVEGCTGFCKCITAKYPCIST